MSKVYIVTEGDYSDYHIEKVFSKKEDAELYVQLNKSDYYSMEVEEYEIDNVKLPDEKDVIHYYFCSTAIYHSETHHKYYILECNIKQREKIQLRTEPSGYKICEFSSYYTNNGDKKIATIESFSQKSQVHAFKILIEQFQIYSQQAFEDGKL
ncbi:MAG: hypothetical protein PHV37_09210 [Candidatus Gastranaerophilales bacterium]|nr:hypothetical protein [Candidatus Gastranaerophilales bacterium]